MENAADSVPREFLCETSSDHMTRMATEARAATTSSCRGTQRRATSCATRYTGCHRKGAAGEMVTITPRDEEAEDGNKERLEEEQEGDVGVVDGEEGGALIDCLLGGGSFSVARSKAFALFFYFSLRDDEGMGIGALNPDGRTPHGFVEDCRMGTGTG